MKRERRERMRMRETMRTQARRVIKFRPTPLKVGYVLHVYKELEFRLNCFFFYPWFLRQGKNKDPRLLSFFFLIKKEHVYEAEFNTSRTILVPIQKNKPLFVKCQRNLICIPQTT